MGRRRYLGLLLGLLLLLLAGFPGGVAAGSPPPVDLSADAPSHSLDGHLAFLEDPQGTLGIDAARGHRGFEAVTPHRPGLTSGTLWYRFDVRPAAGAGGGWVLAFGEPDIDDVRVYVTGPDGAVSETVLGRRVPASRLGMASRLHVAPLSLPEGVETTVHIRLSSLHKIRFEEAALWRPTALTYDEARRSALHGLSLGVMAVFIAAYVLFGIWLRDAPMLAYAAFVLTALCREMTHSGVAPLLLPEGGAGLNYLLSAVGLFGGISAFMLMWDMMLDLRRTFPAMHRVYRWGGILMLAPIFLAETKAFSLLAPFAHPVMLAASAGSIGMAGLLVMRRPHDVLLKFYLCAFVPVVLVWCVEVGALVSDAVPLDLGRRIDAVATLIHLGILCLALGYRFVVTRRRQHRAETALAGERMARERQKTFVDMVTHEFKTPLAVIDSTAQLLDLLLPGASAEVSGRLLTIRKAVRRLVGLIDTCLSGERFESMELDLRPVSPAAIVAQAAARDRETGRGEIRTETAGLPETCRADAILLGIALDALIDNARRHGGAGLPVDVSARAADGRISFAVEDRGPGVPPGEVGHIFDKYYRSPASGSASGFGIGLHLVKTIAAMHGGTVECLARDGGGASFVLTIPGS